MTNNTTDMLEKMRQVAEWLGSKHLRTIAKAHPSNDLAILFASLARAEMAKKGFYCISDISVGLVDFYCRDGTWITDLNYKPKCALSEAHAVIEAIWEVMEGGRHDSVL